MLIDVIFVLKMNVLLHLDKEHFIDQKKKNPLVIPESSLDKSFIIVVVSNKDFSCNSPFFNSHTAAIGALTAECHTGLPVLSNAITTPVCN